MSELRPTLGAAVVLVLLMACAPTAPATPTSPPPQATVQAAGTQVSGAAGAVSTAVQTAVVQPTVAAAGTTVAGAGSTVTAARTEVVATVQGQATAVAPTVQAGATSAVATVVGQATAITAQRQAAATAVAPTAQAVATHVAPTVQAAATQAVAGVSTSVAASPVKVTNVKVDSSDTTVTIQNSGTSPMNLNGYTLVMGPNFSVTLGDIAMTAGQTRTLHFSQGTDTTTDVFLGFGSNVASQSLAPGTRVVLVAPADTIASVYPMS